MTVCIAAICTHWMEGYPPVRMIIGASDRMYTAGDWTYEPDQSKRYDFSFTASALVSGLADDNISICAETHRRITAQGITLIREIANIYAIVFGEFRREQAGRKVLWPFGLTLDTYGDESPERVDRLERELKYWELEDAAIIIGSDEEGVHIYEVNDPGVASCHDAIGFTAIGSGSDHAAAEFMRARFDKRFTVARTLLLAYRAKKAAEVDAFVGEETDMFVLAPGADQQPGLNDELFDRVKRVHRRLVAQDRTARKKADERIERDVKEHLLKTTTQPAVQQGEIPEGAGNEPKRLHDGAQESEPEG